MAEAERSSLFKALGPMRDEALGPHQLSVESCDNREREMRDWLQHKIEAEDRRLKTLGERIIRAMQDFRRDYPLETQEMDAKIEAAFEYEALLAQLSADDLPRFERRFKELLNENTIREVANFQSCLSGKGRRSGSASIASTSPWPTSSIIPAATSSSRPRRTRIRMSGTFSSSSGPAPKGP